MSFKLKSEITANAVFQFNQQRAYWSNRGGLNEYEVGNVKINHNNNIIIHLFNEYEKKLILHKRQVTHPFIQPLE